MSCNATETWKRPPLANLLALVNARVFANIQRPRVDASASLDYGLELPVAFLHCSRLGKLM